MSSISNYCKQVAVGVCLSALGAYRWEVSLNSFLGIGILAAGQVLVHKASQTAQNCRKSLGEFYCERLDLSGKNLTATPDISGYCELEQLDLSNNRLSAVAKLSLHSKLLYLDIRENKLEESPVLSKLRKLLILQLSNNRLIDTPDVSQCDNLLYLHLENNRLERLHDSVFRLSRNCVVHLDGNRFSSQYIQEAQQKTVNLRAENPNLGPDLQFGMQSFPRVAFWAQENIFSDIMDGNYSGIKIN